MDSFTFIIKITYDLFISMGTITTE